jgi:hypothetical protein
MLGKMAAPEHDRDQKSTVDNGWNGWFPPEQTKIVAVIPKWNPDEPLPPKMVSFAYGIKNGNVFVYPSQAQRLLTRVKSIMSTTNAKGKAVKPTQAIYSYVQLSREELLAGTLNREYVIVRPEYRVSDRTVVSTLHYGDEQNPTINVIATWEEM